MLQDVIGTRQLQPVVSCWEDSILVYRQSAGTLHSRSVCQQNRAHVSYDENSFELELSSPLIRTADTPNLNPTLPTKGVWTMADVRSHVRV